MERKLLIAGNWKMNLSFSEASDLTKQVIAEFGKEERIDVLLCPSFVYLHTVEYIARGTRIAVGAQNCYWEQKGAFTGEISAPMIKSLNCSHVILGHSERRHVFGETNEMVNKEMHAVYNENLIPVLCVGETIEERKSGKLFDVVKEQLVEGLKGINLDNADKLVIAYEPVWAIGTGEVATPDQAQEMHEYIRKLMNENYGGEISGKVRILYGGSVKPGNASELLSQKDIDGALIGGASLKADSFIGIGKAVL